MPKKARELSALEVGRLTTPGMYAVGGVAGLHLQVLPKGGRTWVLRVVVGDKRREIGLGGFPDVPLASARQKAREAKEMIAQGIDPVAEARAQRSALMAQNAKQVTFSEATARFIDAKESEWKNPKHRQQWRNTLGSYAEPILGKLFVSDITHTHILAVLEPIWGTKTETASRVRGRIESVLNWATSQGFRSGENPARWSGHLENLLATPTKVKKARHHPALPYERIYEFLADLKKSESTGSQALLFGILTAARSGEVREVRWNEIDLNKQLWTIPAGRMKAGKEHVVPLSPQAMTVLKQCHSGTGDGSGLVFPAPRGGALSDMTLTATLRRMSDSRVRLGQTPWVDAAGEQITFHGFRSTFRDWAGESTAHPREVIEHALAHQLRDKAEAAYARGTLLSKRRQLMADWANYCDRKPNTAAEIIPIRGAV